MDLDRDRGVHTGDGRLDRLAHGGRRERGAQFEAVGADFGHLRDRPEDRGVSFLAHRFVLGVLRNSDYLHRGVQFARAAFGAKRAANGVYVGEELPRQTLIDHRDGLGISRVGGGEVAPGEQWSAQGSEIIGVHEIEISGIIIPNQGMRRVAMDYRVPLRVAQWRCHRARGGDDSG